MKTKFIEVYFKLFIWGMVGLLFIGASCDADRVVPHKQTNAVNPSRGAITLAPQRGHKMEISEIEGMILAKDWSVLDHISRLGPNAVPMLSRLLQNPDPQVRKLVILCLEQVKGPAAAGVLARAIDDPDEQVRVYAADMLLINHDPSILPTMLSAVTNHEDPRIRSKTALVIGLIGDRNSLDYLKKVLISEQNANVCSSLQQAMARLGDLEAKTAILKQLISPNVKTQFEVLEKIEYINDQTLVKEIAWMLDNSSPIMVLAASETARVVLRLKDASAKVIAVLLDQPFTFKLTSYRVCTDAEIQEIKTYLQKQRLIK